MNRPLFSILHSSARPHKWREIYDAWIKAAVNPEQVEYVLCADERWGFVNHEHATVEQENAHDETDCVACWQDTERDGENVVVWNTSRRCYVDGVNTAAQASTGRILIVNADDQYPCEGWDRELRGMLASRTQGEQSTLEGFLHFGERREWVIEVSTGTPTEHERGILVMPILSRARYERLGYVFYPEYESMFADNEFCEHARQDEIIIDARHLFFPHRHAAIDPEAGKWKKQAQVDEPYLVQNRAEAMQLGQELLAIRRKEKFDPTLRHNIERKEETTSAGAFVSPETNGAGSVNSPRKQPVVALCWPGETFNRIYLKHFFKLFAYLWSKGYAVWDANEYTSNVYVTREQIRRVMLAQEPKAELFLWFDDDNPAPTPEQFELLLQDLNDHPEVDGVTGWCWIYNSGNPNMGHIFPSCGTWAPDSMHWRPFDPVIFPNEQQPRLVEATGFPCFLMRRTALEKVGDLPFSPILSDEMDHGISGEDHAYCQRAQKAGLKFLAEPRVRVQHLKTCDATPEVPKIVCDPVIAVMMRVKNESRWLKRCINSVISLAGPNVFVMDDESTDGTYELAQSLGVNVYDDPFAGEPLDETRDKEWLLQRVKECCDPDWILCIDGDEELEPDGAEMIRRILSTNPDVDVFALNFLYLWDSFDQIRVDGRFSSLGRESLFRAKAGISFKSYYEGKDGEDPRCHVGLHCGNAPVTEGRRQPINVNLLHYGYVFREDRIRKYRWYRSIDPDNPLEDNYRHIVIGDLPEFPKDMKMQFGGPLKLIKLTPRMVPTFDVQPEPLTEGSGILTKTRDYSETDETAECLRREDEVTA